MATYRDAGAAIRNNDRVVALRAVNVTKRIFHQWLLTPMPCYNDVLPTTP